MPILALFAGLAGLIVAAPEAEAAHPPARGGLDVGGGYVQFTPGVVGIGIAGDDFDRDLRTSWTGGIGVGGLFVRGPFKATFGFAFEHQLLMFDNANILDYNGRSLHFLAESRIGAGTDRVWGYGLIGFGPSMTLLRGANSYRPDPMAFSGVNLQLGGGVQGMITRHFFLGGEFDIDHGFYSDRYRHQFNDRGFSYHTMTLKFMLGWYF